MRFLKYWLDRDQRARGISYGFSVLTTWVCRTNFVRIMYFLRVIRVDISSKLIADLMSLDTPTVATPPWIAKQTHPIAVYLSSQINF